MGLLFSKLSSAWDSTVSLADFSNPGKTRRISRSAGSRTEARGGVIFIAVPFLAVWADRERAGDSGIAVVSGK